MLAELLLKRVAKPSKTTNAFNKFLLTATALAVFSCGGVETDNKKSNTNNTLPHGIFQAINEKGLTDVYDATKDDTVLTDNRRNEELSLFKSELHSFCENKYSKTEKYDYDGTNFLANPFILPNSNEIKEFYMKSILTIYDGEENVFNSFMYFEDLVRFRQAKSRSPPGIVFFFFFLDIELYYFPNLLHGFRYLEKMDGDNIKAKKAPYFVPCLYYYKNDGSEKSFGRFIIIPYKKFLETADSLGIPHDEIFKHIESTDIQ